MALTAVAFQDHMMRSLSLQDPLKKKKINHRLPVTPRNSSKVLQSTNRKVKKNEPEEEKEYVLDPKPPSLTLGLKVLNNIKNCYYAFYIYTLYFFLFLIG